MKPVAALPLTFLILAACSEERRPNTEPPADGGVVVDAGPEDAGTRDGGPRRDAGPDDSLDGTSLEGIVVTWDDTLSLCSAWRENRSLAEELAAKVQITLGPHTRALGRNHLEGATLADAVVRYGPLEADRVPASRGVTSTLARWQLRNPEANTSLDAVIEHRFSDGGLLEEHYGLTRPRGSAPAPVVVGAEDYEVTFWYHVPGASDVSWLEPCGGPSTHQPVVQAMVGTNGAEAIAVYRYENALFLDAGSSSVVPTAAVVVRSDRPWEVFRAYGFWAQTYAAMHHNFDESSVIDFTRDLGWHEMAYEPFLDGGTPLAPDMMKEVRLVDVVSFGGNARIEVDMLDFSSGRTVTTTYTTDGMWRPVEAARAGMHLGGRCRDPDVVTIGHGISRYAFHLLSCPGSTGATFPLDMLVPVAFVRDTAQVGLPFDGAAIQPIQRSGRDGYAVTVGTRTVELTKAAGDAYFFVDILENGQVVESSLMGELDLDLPFVWEESLAFASTDGTVTARLDRRWAAQGVGESSIFAPIAFELAFGGERYVGESWDALDYTNTHHNWLDALDARVDGVILHWETMFQPTATNRVSATRASDGAVLLAPTEVEILR